ncbi:MAG TPA: hypothetical protein VFO25_13515 [Candidatus Eremiobacteraceae bacterium]|nr:hypothetical protein [Candidatus Eremiobacteraceae bacterium]
MARLTEGQAESLISALTRDTGVYAATSSAPSDPSAWHPAEGVESPPTATETDTDARRLRAFARDAAKTDEVGRTLTLDLASYLRRPVRCSLNRAAPAIASSWRFGAKIDGGMAWIDIDTGLASAFADAMIGGDGTAQIGRGRKVRGLASIVAKRMLDAIAAAAAVGLRGPVEATAQADEHGPAIAGGFCAVAIDQFPWAIGVAASVPLAAQARPSPVDDKRRPLHTTDPEEALRNAIDALDTRLSELTLNRVIARQAKIERIDGAEVAGPPGVILGLALTAGGNGVVVAFADAAAVSGIAGAAAGGAAASATGVPGEIALAAAEAVVRDALERAVVNLPALGDEGHRIVRLSDDPLTARTPHHAVDVEVSSEGKKGTLRVLVPSWMLVHREKKGR